VRAFVHSQKRPEAVPGAVLHPRQISLRADEKKKKAHPIVQPIPPQRLARQDVELMPRSALWEHRTVDRNLRRKEGARQIKMKRGNSDNRNETHMALQHARKRVTLLWRGTPKVHRPRRVAGAVPVLPARVTKNETRVSHGMVLL
jgi:hypothetical protein